MCSLCSFLKSTIGRKVLMALTGLILVLFVLGHMHAWQFTDFLGS